METRLRTKNIVFVGLFDPSIFDKYFFIKNEIIREDEIMQGSRFDSISGVQLISKSYDIIILQNQIIISSKDLVPSNNEISNVTSSILRLGNVINIVAFGINFHWFLEDNSKSLADLSKGLFYDDRIQLLSKFFNNPDSVFGVYASTDFKDARLKLDVKPNILQEVVNNSVVTKDAIGYVFNFHFDVRNKTNNIEVLNYLSDYSLYEEESLRIISIYK